MKNPMAGMHREIPRFADKRRCCSHSGRARKTLSVFWIISRWSPLYGIGARLVRAAISTHPDYFHTEYRLHVNSA